MLLFRRSIRHFSTFSELGLDSKICENLKQLNIVEPTPIQAKTFPVIMKKKNVLMGSETGSGKTLAYLLPTIQMHQKAPTRAPKVMIIAPRRELITQVSEMGNAVYDRFKSESVLAYPPWQPSTSILSNYILSTPNQIFRYMKSPYFKSIDTVILDEVDFLLDSSSIRFIWPILRYLKNHLVPPLQFIFSGATISFEGKKAPGILLKKFLPDLQIIESDNNHRINPKLKIEKFEFENEEDKLKKLIEVLSSDQHKSILIFVNTVKSMQIIDDYLKNNKFTIPYERFNKNDLPFVKEKKLKAFLENKVKILITTDIMSRGINTLNVDCVLQYDFPKDIISYIHRCGRTGRCNTNGNVISFVDKWEDNLLVKEIEKVDLSSSKLDTLFSRKRRLNKRIKKEIKLKDEERKRKGELESIEAGKKIES